MSRSSAWKNYAEGSGQNFMVVQKWNRTSTHVNSPGFPVAP